MDKVVQYQQLLQQLLTQYAQNDVVEEGVETQLVFDKEGHHYYWMNIGWDGNRRVHYSIVHFDIKDGKIWIQQNATEIDIGQELVNLGVPSSDIVVGFHPPYMRQFTEFAVS